MSVLCSLLISGDGGGSVCGAVFGSSHLFSRIKTAAAESDCRRVKYEQYDHETHPTVEIFVLVSTLCSSCLCLWTL